MFGLVRHAVPRSQLLGKYLAAICGVRSELWIFSCKDHTRNPYRATLNAFNAGSSLPCVQVLCEAYNDKIQQPTETTPPAGLN